MTQNGLPEPAVVTTALQCHLIMHDINWFL